MYLTISSWSVLKRRRVEISVAGELPHGTSLERGEGMGQLVLTSPQHFVSHPCQVRAKADTPPYCSETPNTVYKCALCFSVISISPKGTLLSQEHWSLSTGHQPQWTGLVAATWQRGLRDKLSGLWGSGESWGSSVNLHSFKTRKATLHMWYLNLGFTWLTLPRKLVEFCYFCGISSLWSLSASSQSLFFKQKVIK